MTQASGQAPAQVQTQVQHPIHEEQATHERLTKLVSEMPENDPHAGTDMETPKQESQPEAKAEEKVEEVADEGEKVEFDEETPIFDVELKTETGKEAKKLSLKEMRDGYLRMQDYHRNIQKVKAQEAELSTKAQQAELKAIQEYSQRLETHKQAVMRLSGVKSIEDIYKIAESDPAAAQQEHLKLIRVSETIRGLESEQRAAAEKHQIAARASHIQAIEKSKQILESDIPGWGAELYTKVLGGVAKDYGFQNTEVEPVVDARLIKVFHDAYQYRQLQRAKPEISKKVVSVPKVVKPGSAQSQNTSNEVQELQSRLKKTGSGDDFVALYLAKQKQQKRK